MLNRRKESNEGTSAHAPVVLCSIATAGTALLVQRALGFSRFFPINVMVIFGLFSALIVFFAQRYVKSRFFGPANGVTLVRSALTAMLLAIIAENGGVAAAREAWCAAIIATVVLVLDGVDGWLARRCGEASDFGARFDMETDALLILATATLAWHFDKAGPWIVAAGWMRYMFVAASSVLPWMRRPLPVSRRRKTIFVAQAVSLILCVVPVVSYPISGVIAFAGLVLLTGSFLTDIAWLFERDDLAVGDWGE